MILSSTRLCCSDVGGRCLCRLCPQPTTGSDRGHAEREPGEQDFADGGNDFIGLEQVQPQRYQRWGQQMSRGQRSRRAGEGGAGELLVERRGQPGLAGTQTVPEQEGGETGVSREETLLSVYGLWEDVRQVVPPQSPPKGPYR